MSDQVGPQAIYVVGRDDDDDDDSVAGGSEVSDDAASWETVEDTEMENLQKTLEVRFNSNDYNALNIIFLPFTAFRHQNVVRLLIYTSYIPNY